MDTFKVLSAFYIKEKDALLVSVEGRDARFKRGARIRDAFGRRYEIGALVSIGGISDEAADIGRLIQFDD